MTTQRKGEPLRKGTPRQTEATTATVGIAHSSTKSASATRATRPPTHYSQDAADAERAILTAVRWIVTVALIVFALYVAWVLMWIVAP